MIRKNVGLELLAAVLYFRWLAAHESQGKNSIGKQCTRKPHAQYDEGALTVCLYLGTGVGKQSGSTPLSKFPHKNLSNRIETKLFIHKVLIEFCC